MAHGTSPPPLADNPPAAPREPAGPSGKRPGPAPTARPGHPEPANPATGERPPVGGSDVPTTAPLTRPDQDHASCVPSHDDKARSATTTTHNHHSRSERPGTIHRRSCGVRCRELGFWSGPGWSCRRGAVEEFVDGGAGALVAGGHEVGVGAEGESGVCVAEVVGEGDDGFTGVKECGGVEVA